MKRWIYWALLFSLFLAVFLSPLASSAPDGLEKVAEELGFGEQVIEPLFQSPIPDYTFPGVDNEILATSLSGLLGTLITFGVAYGLSRLAKLRED